MNTALVHTQARGGTRFAASHRPWRRFPFVMGANGQVTDDASGAADVTCRAQPHTGLQAPDAMLPTEPVSYRVDPTLPNNSSRLNYTTGHAR